MMLSQVTMAVVAGAVVWGYSPEVYRGKKTEFVLHSRYNTFSKKVCGKYINDKKEISEMVYLEEKTSDKGERYIKVNGENISLSNGRKEMSQEQINEVERMITKHTSKAKKEIRGVEEWVKIWASIQSPYDEEDE